MSKNEFVCDCNVIHQDIVDKIINEMLEDEFFYKMADFYKILGDTTRMKILYALDKEEMCVCDIANVLSMSKSSISHQLGTLRRSGIVRCRKAGKEVYYMLDDDHVRKVIEIGIDHIEHKEKGGNKNEK
ncbi:MAG: metalloregulator ArsR/SmtB family transcription factor [Clostridium sp.]|nr:metalloregulator ArsR/SmtB family transcription factor [Clostridium sp.]MCM1443839.1 metalloregulator ArsR/SmtB family transcription factor [Candidatus Amulumruptor caecigallinarius]